jgi:hypothetical protein
MTVAEIRKNVFGVSDINNAFLNKIAELTFQQTKMLSLRGLK